MTPSLATLRCDEKEGMNVMRNVGSDTQAIAVSLIDQNEPGPATSLQQSISVAELYRGRKRDFSEPRDL
jgi:hypothetical protein